MADSCEMMLRDTKLPEIMAKEKPGLYKQIREWIANFAEKLRKAFTGIEARHEEARAMMQYAEEMQQIWDNALAGAVRNAEAATENGTTAPNNGTARVRNSFKGYDEETGKKIYEANFPKGTPREAKAERILHYIQNVWSKKPISLVIRNEDGSSRKIEAQFDPTYSEQQGEETDARKLMGGNKHGSAAEKRVTLDLADDYYDIATDATYNYSKGETGKTIATHEGVTQWHYFINDILFQEYGEKETTPYRVTIDVKERSDGQFVYSFSAERQNKRSGTRRTLHAAVTHTENDVGNAQSSETTIPQPGEKSNPKFSVRERDEDLQKKYPRLNLNEDISELDGVPAIELTDGSILPIKDRERYRTHVSFIEGNRIDVDDLRSGGWIGNGVYDASFTSDTARYIEQQQAKKRVAELRGVPYDQFGDGNTRYSMRDTAYTTAVESGNTEDAQRLVDEAAEEALENSEARLTDRGEFRMGAGKLATVYHATYNDFTVFDRARLGENTDAYASDESTAATAHLGFWFNTQPLSQSASYAGGKDVKAWLGALRAATAVGSRAPCGACGLKFLLFLCWYVFDLVAPRMGRIV